MDKAILAYSHTRKIALAVVLTAVLSAIFASVAYAQLIEGTNQSDLLVGTPQDDVIFGNAGDDEIRGGGKTDDLHGGIGNDTLIGQGGSDRLRGQGGDDDLYGGPDNTQGTQKETDVYFCGNGFDTVHLEKGEHSGHNVSDNCEQIVKE